MRSSDEQQVPVESLNTQELRLLSEVEDTPDITQRELSQRVGIALGLTNILVRSLTQKGYLRVAQASWKRRLYTLTPEGFSHRFRLMTGYINRFLDHYKKVRQTLREELAPLAMHSESRVAIYGTGEFAELVYMGLREIGIEEIDIFKSNGTGLDKFLGMPVRDVSQLNPDQYDRVLVAFLLDPGAARDELRDEGITGRQIVTFFGDGRARDEG